MALDPYSSCPCGSGKKFKWCCQPIHTEIQRAFEQHNAGQHEAALVAMQALVKDNSGNPEAWGRQAQLFGLNGKLEEAEQALEKAFAINPSYAFGYLLRGQFRLAEGELIGALLLFRKASELYSPDAQDTLAYVYQLIADIEMRLNRPVAARAAIKLAMHHQPANAELRENFDAIFGEKGRLPNCARKDYSFIPPRPTPPGWTELLNNATTGRLIDARTAFAEWTQSRAADKAGWFNLGLVSAWLGDNAAAVEALRNYIDRENDEAAAGDAWALCEVLRCADSMLDEADYSESRAVFSLSKPEPVMALLDKWEKGQRIIGLRANPEQGILTGLVLEPSTRLVETVDVPAYSKLAAYLLVAGNALQLWHSNPSNIDKLVEEVQQAFGSTPVPLQRERAPIMFTDVCSDAMIFPTKQTTELDAGIKVREAAASYFEDRWIHQPLKALSGNAPIDAVGHVNLRKKLRGVLRFIEDCAGLTSVKLYDFARLHNKLGLESPTAVADELPAEIGAMNAAQLAGMDIEPLSTEQLAEAYRTAIKLDARELAGKFARGLADRPTDAATADRFPFFAHLISLAQSESRWDDALSLVDEGEKADCEGNEGRRCNDYELRRGQIFARKGDATAAVDVFDRLTARAPDELKFLEVATKALLDLKLGPAAIALAEKGLAKARAKNHRDAEEYFLELANAAKRLKA